MEIYKKITLIIIIFVMAVLAGFSNTKAYFTFFEHNYGAKSLALSNAFTATANDLSSVWINPAGLSLIKTPSFYLNFKNNSIIQNFEIEEYANEKYYQELSLKHHNFNFFSISAPVILWDIKFGFAVSYYRYFPYGITGEIKKDKFEDDILTESNHAEISGENGIDVLAVTASFLLNNYFSIGFTYQTLLNSGSLIYKYSYKDDLNDYEETNYEKIMGSNFIIGLIFKPEENISIAFACETRIKGEYNFETIKTQKETQSTQEPSVKNSVGSINIPFRLNFGVSLKLAKYLSFNYDHMRVYWSKGTISNYYENTNDLPFPVLLNFNFEQKDLICNRFGIEGNLSYHRVEFFFRGGVFFDRQFFVDMSDEKIKVRGFSVGLGIKLVKRLEFDLAYMYKKAKWDENGYLDQSIGVETVLNDNIISLSFAYSFFNRQRLK